MIAQSYRNSLNKGISLRQIIFGEQYVWFVELSDKVCSFNTLGTKIGWKFSMNYHGIENNEFWIRSNCWSTYTVHKDCYRT